MKRLMKHLKHLLWDETGAVAMEYVIIALMIGATCVSIVMVFGSALARQFEVVTLTLAGEKGIQQAVQKQEDLANELLGGSGDGSIAQALIQGRRISGQK